MKILSQFKADFCWIEFGQRRGGGRPLRCFSSSTGADNNYVLNPDTEEGKGGSFLLEKLNTLDVLGSVLLSLEKDHVDSSVCLKIRGSGFFGTLREKISLLYNDARACMPAHQVFQACLSF